MCGRLRVGKGNLHVALLVGAAIWKLKFTQIGTPPSRYSGHYRGWIETYWTTLKEILATGAISKKTQARVKIDREQRISTGTFRRKLSRKG